MSEPHRYIARWRQIGLILAPHQPTVLVATITLLDTVLRTIEAPAPAPADPPSEIARQIARWNELGATLESGRFVIFMGTISILDAMLEEIEALEAARSGAPLTARRVLVPARYRGVEVFTGLRDPSTGLQASTVLLATIGLDLTDPEIRAQLLELNRRGEIRLVPVGAGLLSRNNLVHRGERPELIEESAIVDGDATFHAVILPPHDPPVTTWPLKARSGKW